MKRITIIVSIALLAFQTLQASPSDALRRAFAEAAAVSYAPSEELTERFIEYSSYGRANDVLLLQLYNYVHLPDAEVERLMENFDWEKGCWKDIDYSAQDRGSWPSTLHITRMYSLAKIYKTYGNRWAGNAKISQILHSGMAWWYANMPVCPNWWHNDIGVPKKLTTVLLMIRDELSQEEIEGGLRVLERSAFGRTGQNKVWLAGNNLMKGLLIDDAELVKKSRDIIAEEVYVTEEEGIQPDWSFHQHGPQIQFGNYGLTYADVLSFWLRVLKGTEYAFNAEQTAIVCNMLKEGICWSLWKGVMDPSYCGRQNFINGGPGKAFAVAVAAQNMAAALDGEDSEFFAKVASENLQPELYENSLVGSRYYWRSDCGIWRRPAWYASARMHSERTIGFEFTNRENTLANFSADGAMIIMQDGNEFDNIFAYWDWRKVPGVTSYEDGKPLKCDDSEEGKKNHSSHVGGRAGDEAMVTTMELERDGLHALKSMFMFDDCAVNLGTDIRVSREDITAVTTAIDQIHLRGEILSGSNWVHHAGRGYISLDGSPISVSSGVQKGKWDYIDPVFQDKWDEGPVFKAWFGHSVEKMKGSDSEGYAYLVLPCSTAGQTKAFAKKAGGKKSAVKVLRNDSSCQAVSHGKTVCAVFHKAGTYTLAGHEYKIGTPSILIAGAEGENLKPIQ